MSGDSGKRAGTGPGGVTFLVTQVGALAASRFAERLAPLGLNPSHAGLLRAIGAEPGRSQQMLAAQLGLLPSRLVVLIDELESDGLVERRRNPRDRRHYALRLSPNGHERLGEIGRVAHGHGEDMLAPLNERDRATLGRLLGRLAAAHGLSPGVHTGYRSLGREPAAGPTATEVPPAAG